MFFVYGTLPFLIFVVVVKLFVQRVWRNQSEKIGRKQVKTTLKHKFDNWIEIYLGNANTMKGRRYKEADNTWSAFVSTVLVELLVE